MTDLPVYQCHKRVQAAQIMGFDTRSRVVVVDMGFHADSTHHNESVEVPAGFFARSRPEPGDYLVIYDDGYMSHSPKAAFETGYERLPAPVAGCGTSAVIAGCSVGGFSFSAALLHLKDGGRVARAGWNGKGMWLHLIPASHWETTRGLELLDGLPWIGMKTADDKFVPWLASQTDMLAEDWLVVR